MVRQTRRVCRTHVLRPTTSEVVVPASGGPRTLQRIATTAARPPRHRHHRRAGRCDRPCTQDETRSSDHGQRVSRRRAWVLHRCETHLGVPAGRCGSLRLGVPTAASSRAPPSFAPQRVHDPRPVDPRRNGAGPCRRTRGQRDDHLMAGRTDHGPQRLDASLNASGDRNHHREPLGAPSGAGFDQTPDDHD